MGVCGDVREMAQSAEGLPQAARGFCGNRAREHEQEVLSCPSHLAKAPQARKVFS